MAFLFGKTGPQKRSLSQSTPTQNIQKDQKNYGATPESKSKFSEVQASGLERIFGSYQQITSSVTIAGKDEPEIFEPLEELSTGFPSKSTKEEKQPFEFTSLEEDPSDEQLTQASNKKYGAHVEKPNDDETLTELNSGFIDETTEESDFLERNSSPTPKMPSFLIQFMQEEKLTRNKAVVRPPYNSGDSKEETPSDQQDRQSFKSFNPFS